MHLTRRALLSLVLLAPFPSATRPAPALLLEAPVAGFQFHDGPRHEQRLNAGRALVLRRERQNRHDTKAIAIHLPDGPKLGYVPRRLNEIPSRLLDQGVVLSATISKIRPAPAPPWERLTIVIALQGWQRLRLTRGPIEP